MVGNIVMDRTAFIFGSGVSGLAPEDAARHSKRRYVRGEGGLAVYDPAQNPTGHALTAWEAYTAFGLDVLEEALEYGSAILKKSPDSTRAALKRQRESLGLTHKQVARAANVAETEAKTAETKPSEVSIQKLERIAFALGLDERRIAFELNPGADARLAYRLKTLQADRASAAASISSNTARLFAEAAAIIRAQLRLQKWLGLHSEKDEFNPSADYGSSQAPAWLIGYNLASQARSALNLGDSPIASMRELVEERLGIPVIQARLPNAIAGATVMSRDENGDEARGVVLNTTGDNRNVWIRRATLAHELGHLLYDPNERLDNLRVDSYKVSQADAQTYSADYVEQRANAFAIAFLAPNEAVRRLTPTPISGESVSRTMREFGISHTAARSHIYNCHYQNFNVPEGSGGVYPSDEWKAAENFATDYFPIDSVPEHRSGRFAGLTATAYEENLITADTGALYLSCGVDEFRGKSDILKSLYAVG